MGDECRVQKKFTLNQAGRQKPSADRPDTMGWNQSSGLRDGMRCWGCRGSPGG